MDAVNRKIEEQENEVEEILITCPCCGEEIISPRGELNKLIKLNADKIKKCVDEIKIINDKYKSSSLSQEEKIELGKRKCKLCQELELLNKVSSEYKRRRQVLAEHETVSAYQTLKQVLLERYGDKEYLDCIQKKKKRVQVDEENSKRVIRIL